MLFQASLGIDVEEAGVSMVYLKTSFRGVILAAQEMYPTETNASPQEKLKQIKEAVNDFVLKNRVAAANVYLSIPREMVIVRYMELPVAAKENLRETLRYEMERYVPFSVDDVYFDYKIVSEDPDSGRMLLLVLVVGKETIAPYFDFAAPIGAGISGIEIGSTAVANFCLSFRRQGDGRPLALVHLKGDHLEFSLLKDRVLSYSKSVSVRDPENLAGTIRQELEALKEAANGESGDIHAACLGFGEEDGPFQEAAKELEMNIRGVDLSEAGIFSDGLISAYGLALRGIRKVPMGMNLLPGEFRKRPNRFGQYVMYGLLGLTVLAVLAWGGGRLLRQNIYLDRLNAELESLGTEVARLNEIRAKSEAVEKQVDYLNGLRGQGPVVLDVLNEFSERIPETAWVRNLNFTGDEVQIDGYADSASELIPLLEASPLFKDVSFLSRITKNRDGTERFRIGLKID